MYILIYIYFLAHTKKFKFKDPAEILKESLVRPSDLLGNGTILLEKAHHSARIQGIGNFSRNTVQL
jgi:hypothetical protein